MAEIPTFRPIRVQMKRVKGWRIPPNTKSVMRPGRFGNPYRAERWGLERCLRLYRQSLEGGWSPEIVKDLTDGEVHEIYQLHRAFLTRFGGGSPMNAANYELRGFNLGCSCPPDRQCHADVLLEVLYGK